MDIGSIIQEYCVPIITMVVFCICFAIKQAFVIKNKYIPLIAIVLGGISGVIVNGLSYDAVAIGIASGAAATCIHQIYKQLQKDDDYTI